MVVELRFILSVPVQAVLRHQSPACGEGGLRGVQIGNFSSGKREVVYFDLVERTVEPVAAVNGIVADAGVLSTH